MQNVLLQQGLCLLSLTGRAVRKLKSWVLKCDGCRSILKDKATMANALFCPICGGNFLARLSVTVGSDGVVEYGYNPNRKVNLRGTIYSIPKPKGGRQADLLLRADQLQMGVWRRRAGKKTVKSNHFSAAVTESVGFGGIRGKGDDVVVGFGRSNPNARRGRER